MGSQHLAGRTAHPKHECDVQGHSHGEHRLVEDHAARVVHRRRGRILGGGTPAKEHHRARHLGQYVREILAAHARRGHGPNGLASEQFHRRVMYEFGYCGVIHGRRVPPLDPHLCRCGIHNRVIRAVQKAAGMTP